MTQPSEGKNLSIPKNGEVLKGSPSKKFRQCETKTFSTENRDTTPLIPIVFRYRKLGETMTGSPTKFFGSVRQTFFDGKS